MSSTKRVLTKPRSKPAATTVPAERKIKTLEDENRRLREQLDRAGARKNGPVRATPATEEAVTIQVWEDDPFLEAVAGADPVPAEPIGQDEPENDHALLQTVNVDERPDPDVYDTDTGEFRFWNAQAALARGINFWAPLLPPGTTWSTFDEPMRVNLDDGVDLNAFYARSRGLVFFHDEVAGNTVFSGGSPDVVCHELGHAILDALKPELFDVMSIEIGAFHEAFGDISGMLSALQLPSMRAFVLEQTDGDLRLNSRVSQMARELGWAIRQFAPTAVDRDCLRNAANAFVYQNPSTLPSSAPADDLSAEVHSFSRVFTGGFLDVLAGMFETDGTAADDADRLAEVSADAGRLVAEGIRLAAVGPGYYGQVAAGMIQADHSLFGGRYRAAVTSAFVRRGILAAAAAVSLVRELKAHGGQAFGVAGGPAKARTVQFEGDNEGYKKSAADAPAMPLRSVTTRFGTTVHVHLPAEPQRFAVAAAAVTGGAAGHRSPEDEARAYVEDLIQQDRIDADNASDVLPAELIAPGQDYPSDKTHRLEKTDGKVVLKRNHFDCGYRGCRHGR